MDWLRGLRSLCALGAVLAGLAMWASAARAADGTFCVNDPSCVSAGGTAEPDVQSALNAADLNEPGSELVELGPGTYTAPNGFSDSSGANAISVVGAGETETALTATTPGATVLDFNGDLNSSVSDLSVDMASSGGIGAYIPQHITNVVINYSGATAATALWTQTTTVNNVRIRMPLTGSLTTQGIYRQTGTLTADGLTITADSGIIGGGFDDSYNDTRIFADGSGIDLANDVNSPSGFAKISNSQA